MCSFSLIFVSAMVLVSLNGQEYSSAQCNCVDVIINKLVECRLKQVLDKCVSADISLEKEPTICDSTTLTTSAKTTTSPLTSETTTTSLLTSGTTTTSPITSETTTSSPLTSGTTTTLPLTSGTTTTSPLTSGRTTTSSLTSGTTTTSPITSGTTTTSPLTSDTTTTSPLTDGTTTTSPLTSGTTTTSLLTGGSTTTSSLTSGTTTTSSLTSGSTTTSQLSRGTTATSPLTSSTTTTSPLTGGTTTISKCPINWKPFGKSCYYFNTTAVNFTSAVEQCKALNAHLVYVDSSEVDKFIRDNIKRSTVSGFWWIGLSDEDKDGSWKWVGTERVATFQVWAPGEPYNDPALKYAFYVCFPNCYWRAASDTSEASVICEKTQI